LTRARIADLAALARAMCSGIGLPLGLQRWMRLFAHVGLEPRLVLAAAIGAVGPDIAGGVGGVDQPAQLVPIALGR
jgi:hypothetical protein